MLTAYEADWFCGDMCSSGTISHKNMKLLFFFNLTPTHLHSYVRVRPSSAVSTTELPNLAYL